MCELNKTRIEFEAECGQRSMANSAHKDCIRIANKALAKYEGRK